MALFQKEYNTQKSLEVDISQTVTINLGLVILIFGWVKTLEWQGPVQLPSTPTLGVFLIVTVLPTFHPCKWLDMLVCSKDCLIADLSDHVFYGGCFSVDCWLTYRPPCLSRFGRVSSDCRSWFGLYIGRVVFPVGRDSIGSVSAMYRWNCRSSIGKVSVVYRYWPLELQSWSD